MEPLSAMMKATANRIENLMFLNLRALIGPIGPISYCFEINDVAALAFSRDGALLASGGSDKAVRVWTLADGSSIELAGQKGAIKALAFHPDGRYAYVANTVSNDITVIDTASHEPRGTITAGVGAHLPAISADGRYGYVANFAADSLIVWSCRDHRPLATLAVGVYPHFFALSGDGRWIVVSNTGESSICLFDAHTQELRARLEVGGAPAHIAFSPDNECAFVACERSDEVAVVDLGRAKAIELLDAGKVGESTLVCR